MATHQPPKFREPAFHCPHCNTLAQQNFDNLTFLDKRTLSTIYTTVHMSKCLHCNKTLLWLEDNDGSAIIIYPHISVAQTPHEDMPEDCKALYTEAQQVLPFSKRAAVALIRLIVQKLMPHLGQDTKNDLDACIGNLVRNGLSQNIQQALDTCRVIGNHAVHPGTIDFEETPEVANHLLGIVNFLVEELIARPKRNATMFANLPAPALKAIEERNEKSLTKGKN